MSSSSSPLAGGTAAAPAAAAAAASALDGNIPVFVFPAALDFYADDQTTHKRVVTIYNPYDVDVNFKVLCNNPKKYAVVEPEGRISGQKCADIVVRHVAVSPQSVQQPPDKFRIHMYEEGSLELLGKRDIIATLHPGVPEAEARPAQTSLVAVGAPERGATAGARVGGLVGGGFGGEQAAPNLVACGAAVACIIALFLPTDGDTAQLQQSALRDYPYLHLTVNQKLVFAYVLGLVTMAILRPA